MTVRTGTAAAVPYVAVEPISPEGTANIVVVLHMMDPPRSERAMASALPLQDVAPGA